MAEINRLKQQARALYIRIYNQKADLTCGNALAEIIRPSVARDKAEFNRIMTRLREIDPDYLEPQP